MKIWPCLREALRQAGLKGRSTISPLQGFRQNDNQDEGLRPSLLISALLGLITYSVGETTLPMSRPAPTHRGSLFSPAYFPRR